MNSGKVSTPVTLASSVTHSLPSAEKYGNHHLTILGAIFGMFVMVLSLLAFL
jgi:ZIP family zinc transporter